MSRLARGLVTCGLAVGLGAGPAAAAPLPRPPAELSLATALDVTALREPAIALAIEEATVQEGIRREARGAFDLELVADLVYERSRGALLDSQLEAEEQRRDLFRTIIEEFTAIADDLERQLEEGGRPVVDCRSANLIINGVDICVSDTERLVGETFDEMLRRLIAEADPETRQGLELLQQQILDQTRQVTENIINVLRLQVTAARDSLEKLGVVPEVEQEYTIATDLRLQELTRTGVTWAFALALDSLQDNYEGKPLNPAFGGKGAPNTFRSFVGLALRAPLGKGRGRLAATAFERAAEQSAEAARLQAVHQVSTSLLRTATAYWQVKAAQERSELLEEAAGMERDLAAKVAELIAADELPRVLQARIDARVAAIEQSLAAAELAATRARAALADAMGAPFAAGDDLVATTALPEPAAGAALVEQAEAVDAAAARFDLASAARLAEGTAILSEAARLDLRRRFDLELAAGYSGLHESFQDDFYDPSGFGDALFGKQAGPSVFFGLRVDVPFRNRAALGRLAQSESLATSSLVRRAELGRAIEASVAGIRAELALAAAAIERKERAVALRREQLDNEMERFRLGETTLIESILAEEELTFARLDLIETRLAHALLLARLLHETGALVRLRAGDPWVVSPAHLPAIAGA